MDPEGPAGPTYFYKISADTTPLKPPSLPSSLNVIQDFDIDAFLHSEDGVDAFLTAAEDSDEDSDNNDDEDDDEDDGNASDDVDDDGDENLDAQDGELGELDEDEEEEEEDSEDDFPGLTEEERQEVQDGMQEIVTEMFEGGLWESDH